MKLLTPSRHNAAVQFLKQHGRSLDWSLYRHAFADGRVDAVMDELVHFQNSDGGYGHSLEPDAVAAESSVLDTSHALQVMRRLRVGGEHPQVCAAMNYLRNTYDSEHGVWPLRPYVSADTVCAPWWKFESETHWAIKLAENQFNPTAELLGYLIEYGTESDADWIAELTRRVLGGLAEDDDPLEIHDLLCVARLAKTDGLDPDCASDLMARVRRDAAVRIEKDRGKWDEYGLKPWSIAEFPDDPMLADLDPGLAEAMLDHEIGRQEEDGGWPTFWHWGGLHPEVWPAAHLAWKSVLTEQMLRVLRNFGRLSGARPI